MPTSRETYIKRSGLRRNMDYGSLLKRAKEQMPESVKEKQRFEIPKALGHVEGNKTIITNFAKIAQALGREADHLLKFVLKELATPGVIRREMLIIGTKVSASRVNQKIREYAEEFVLCQECGKPDTKILKEGQLATLRCQACGAKRTVKARI